MKIINIIIKLTIISVALWGILDPDGSAMNPSCGCACYPAKEGYKPLVGAWIILITYLIFLFIRKILVAKKKA